MRSKLRRALRNYIEAELADYHQTKRDILEVREDIIEQSLESNNPTYTKASKLLTCKRLKRMEQVVQAIDKVMERLPPEKQKLVELRYWSNYLTIEGIAIKIQCDRRTVYRWLEGILIAIAVELGEWDAEYVS
ncbi:MAG: phage transcriptional regulator, RinA family [Firmicutes bacterium]|nr:phage transcriptional regulator, RinA family [Bacillota bacterium]